MPRETVYGSELPYGEDEPARSVIEIGWSREAEHVQIATKCVRSDDGADYFPKLEPIEMPEISQRADEEEVAGVLLEVEALGRSGHYVQLDRAAINETIRILRRARDQAFGRDE